MSCTCPESSDCAGSERGSVTAWTAGVALACVMLVGLVMDSGVALRYRSEAFGAAAAAARAGAQVIDEEHLMTRVDHDRVALDQVGATEAVNEFLRAPHLSGLGLAAEVEFPAPDQITVTVRGETELRFLPVRPRVEVDATVVAIQAGPGVSDLSVPDPAPGGQPVPDPAPPTPDPGDDDPDGDDPDGDDPDGDDPGGPSLSDAFSRPDGLPVGTAPGADRLPGRLASRPRLWGCRRSCSLAARAIRRPDAHLQGQAGVAQAVTRRPRMRRGRSETRQ